MVMKSSDYDRRTRGVLDDTATNGKLPKDAIATQQARIDITIRKHSKAYVKEIWFMPPGIYSLPNHTSKLGPLFHTKVPPLTSSPYTLRPLAHMF